MKFDQINILDMDPALKPKFVEALSDLLDKRITFVNMEIQLTQTLLKRVTDDTARTRFKRQKELYDKEITDLMRIRTFYNEIKLKE